MKELPGKTVTVNHVILPERFKLVFHSDSHRTKWIIVVQQWQKVVFSAIFNTMHQAWQLNTDFIVQAIWNKEYKHNFTQELWCIQRTDFCTFWKDD